ncbi:uncharacterized protein G2W53_040459 [Senna tora]|uniref:Uncharacterized protein n=1 Tax=Senna tora TaxID=362788 RepID=A0A834VX94_9FABA|nr:uncharacterized protein G2W53_040459 [Senna tora]
MYCLYKIKSHTPHKSKGAASSSTTQSKATTYINLTCSNEPARGRRWRRESKTEGGRRTQRGRRVSDEGVKRQTRTG